MATLFLRADVRCRSRQLYATLVLPPTNHFANGRSHSRTLFHLSNQCSSAAVSAQNRSGSSAARFRIASYSVASLMCAFNENSRGGGKTRCSFNVDSMFVSAIAVDFPSLQFKEEVYNKRKGRGLASAAFSDFCERCVLLRQPVVFVIHRDIVLPLFRNVVFRKNRGDRAGRLA